MTSRRELQLAIVLSLVGSGLVLLALGRAWVTVTAAPAVTIKATTARTDGSTIVGAAELLGYVGLAGVLAVAATRSWGRRVVGVLLVLAGIAVAAIVAKALGDGLFLRAYPPAAKALCNGVSVDTCIRGVAAMGGTHITESVLWPVVTIVGAVLLVGAGGVVAVRGPGWAALGSSYEVPAARETAAEPTDKATWDQLDAGEDPTA